MNATSVLFRIYNLHGEIIREVDRRKERDLPRKLDHLEGNVKASERIKV